MSLPADVLRELAAIERAWSALEVGDEFRRDIRREAAAGVYSGDGDTGRGHSAARAGGNPYHDAEGKFTGAGGLTGRHARRKRKLRRLIRAHKRRKRALKSKQHAERHALAAKQRESVVKHKAYYDRRKASLARDQHRDLQRMDAEHGREVGRLERIRAKERVQEAGQLQAGKITSEQVTTWEADHARTVEATKRLNAEIRAQRQDWHAGERENLREERRESFGALKESQARHRKAMARRHEDERAQLREEGIEEIEGHGFRHKGAARGLDGSDRADHVGDVGGLGVDEGLRSGRCGAAGRLDAAEYRRIGPGRTHKASEANAILRAALRSLGLTAAYRRGRLTAGQALDVLAAIRDYARGWMHHEFESFIRHYGRAVDEPRSAGCDGLSRADAGTEGGFRAGLAGGPSAWTQGESGSDDRGGMAGEVRGLTSAMRSHVGRLFGRARQFVREAILAGAMALSGPGGLTSDDLAEADRAAQEQAAYLDRFEQDVHLRTPPELAAEPSAQALANPMTAKEFAARAEQYGGAVWHTAVNHDRNRVVRSGKYDQERRVHRKPMSEHHACTTCKGESAKGWVPIGTLLPLGDSECMGINCDCAFHYRKSA